MSQIIVLDSHVWFWWINLEHDRIIIATTLQMDGMLASVDGHFISYSELEGRLIDRKGHSSNGNPP